VRRRRIVHWIKKDVHTKWRRLYARYQRAGKVRKDKNECREDAGIVHCGHDDPLCTMYGCPDDPGWRGDRARRNGK